MPTSDFNITRDDLVRRALRKLGNTRPSTTDIANAVQSLRVITKRIDVQGKWLWAITPTESTVTLSAATQTYSAGVAAANIATDILSLETFSLYIGTQHVPCAILTSETARATLSRDTNGQPDSVFLDRKPLTANNVLWVYPTPNGSFTGKYTYRRKLYDFASVSDNPDFPSEWISCLTYQLVDDLADDYGATAESKQLWALRAQGELRLMQAANQGAIPTGTTNPTNYF